MDVWPLSQIQHLHNVLLYYRTHHPYSPCESMYVTLPSIRLIDTYGQLNIWTSNFTPLCKLDNYFVAVSKNCIFMYLPWIVLYNFLP